MTAEETTTIEKLAASLLNSLDGGFLWAYFLSSKIDYDPKTGIPREEELRNRFIGLADNHHKIHKALEYLNGYYKTRYARRYLKSFSECIKTTITQNQETLVDKILMGGNEDAPLFCEGVITHLLKNLKEREPTTNNPYSLVTKYLHFFKPNLFPIYDSQACESWKLVIRDISFEIPARTTWGHSDGQGYQHICGFYRELWDKLSSWHDEVSSKVKILQEIFYPSITELETLDKFFWMASGRGELLFDYQTPAHLQLRHPLLRSG